MTSPPARSGPPLNWQELIDEARRRADTGDDGALTAALRQARDHIAATAEAAPVPPSAVARTAVAAPPLFTPSTFVKTESLSTGIAPATPLPDAYVTVAEDSPLPAVLRAPGTERQAASGRSQPGSYDGSPQANPTTDKPLLARLGAPLLQAAASPLAQIGAVAIILVGSYLGVSKQITDHAAGTKSLPASVFGVAASLPPDVSNRAIAPLHVSPQAETSRALVSDDGAQALAELAADIPANRDEPASGPSTAAGHQSNHTAGSAPRTAPDDQIATTPGALVPLRDLLDDATPGLAVVIVRGLPPGFSLTGANRGADAGWVIGLDTLATSAIAIPSDAAGHVELQIETIDLAARSIGTRLHRLQIDVPRTNPAPPPERVSVWLAKGRALVAQSDIAAARYLLLAAAEAGEPEAALALAETYDPAALQRASATMAVPDPIRARYWYEAARMAGLVMARDALARMGSVATAPADTAEPRSADAQ
ncbi:MAG: hypothetical protein NW217_12145 [Hyphomicrobiaceae bacterium]|nr:hypothetical protein [Hyphomicrobiaceae bacterium]